MAAITIAEDAMKLVFGQEGEPIDSILLVFTQFRVDGDRKMVNFHFGAVEELGQKFALSLSPAQKFFRKPFGV